MVSPDFQAGISDWNSNRSLLAGGGVNMSGLEASLRTHSGSLCFTLDGSFQEMESCTVYLPDPIRDRSETVTVVSAEINRSRTCVRGAALHPANDRLIVQTAARRKCTFPFYKTAERNSE